MSLFLNTRFNYKTKVSPNQKPGSKKNCDSGSEDFKTYKNIRKKFPKLRSLIKLYKLLLKKSTYNTTLSIKKGKLIHFILF